MSDFTLEPDEIEPERPERRRPVRLVGTGLTPTSPVPASSRRGTEPVSCYVSCEACGALVLRGNPGRHPAGARYAGPDLCRQLADRGGADTA